jgi:hypothetical protein
VVTPFEKFRAQYPKGALISDLVSVQEGQYVVRVAVMQQGETLATGLAASADVQVAEDQARERAIAVLAIAPKTTPNNASATRKVDEPLSQQLSTELLPTVSLPAESLPVEPTLSYAEADLPLEEEDLGLPIDVIAEKPPEVSLPAQPSAATIALENFTSSANPVDLSDVIAQTSIELTRLGWTSDQGREYLEKTYGKRSRQQLTDDELMSFLLHLEEQ